jgi:hypothetical protein
MISAAGPVPTYGMPMESPVSRTTGGLVAPDTGCRLVAVREPTSETTPTTTPTKTATVRIAVRAARGRQIFANGVLSAGASGPLEILSITSPSFGRSRPDLWIGRGC